MGTRYGNLNSALLTMDANKTKAEENTAETHLTASCMPDNLIMPSYVRNMPKKPMFRAVTKNNGSMAP
jgi:hypothetical protein